MDDVYMQNFAEDLNPRPSQFHPPRRLQHHINITAEGRTDTPSEEHAPHRDFSLIYAIVRIPEICLEAARYMDATSILNLYSICGSFHALVNTHMVAVVQSSARQHYPWSTQAFPYHMMAKLCVPDPTGRANELRWGLREGQPRMVPGLKWLAMAHFRCGVVDGVWAALHDRGHRLPRGLIAPAICRIYLLMSARKNATRLALVRSRLHWPDDMLRAAALFLVKLDMAMTEPFAGDGRCELRVLMLGQRSLVPLLRLMLGKMSLVEVEMYRVRWDHVVPAELAHMGYSVLGVPPQHIGRGKYEDFGRSSELALRVDLAILMAANERGLGLHLNIVDMITAGYDEDTNNIPGAEPDGDEIGTILEYWKKKVWFKRP